MQGGEGAAQRWRAWRASERRSTRCRRVTEQKGKGRLERQVQVLKYVEEEEDEDDGGKKGSSELRVRRVLICMLLASAASRSSLLPSPPSLASHSRV